MSFRMLNEACIQHPIIPSCWKIENATMTKIQIDPFFVTQYETANSKEEPTMTT